MKIFEVITGKADEVIEGAEFEDSSVSDLVERLMTGNVDPTIIKDAKAQYFIKSHKVMDPIARKDKKIQRPTGAMKEDGDEQMVTETEFVNRTPIPMQKLIVNKAVSFLFGNDVKMIADLENDDTKKLIFDAVSRIQKDNKVYSLNRKVAKQVFSTTEVAEYWYPVQRDENHKLYGFETDIKIRVRVFSELNGDTLYPLFNENDDMIAFSRGFSVKDDQGNNIECLETWTDEEHGLFTRQDGYNSGQWAESYIEEITIGAIPIIYGRQEQTEWFDVQQLIERLEKLLSNFGDTNDYHASPKITVSGRVMDFSKKGEAGGILELSDGAEAKYLSWDHATDSVKLEIETLLKLINTHTQTPEISFDAVKGLGALSGVALKLLFMDAHLKVMDKKEIFDEYLLRRYNVLKKYIAKMGEDANQDFRDQADELEIRPEITPYMIEDEKALVEMLTDANGGKPVISQKTSVIKAGLSDDPEAEFKQLQTESAEDAKRTADVFAQPNE